MPLLGRLHGGKPLLHSLNFQPQPKKLFCKHVSPGFRAIGRLGSGALVTRDPGGHHAARSPSLPLRPYRPGVGAARTAARVFREARSSAEVARSACGGCRVLSAQERLRLADAAQRITAVADRLLPLLEVASGRATTPSPRAAARGGARVRRA